jgi:hypothetical protein
VVLSRSGGTFVIGALGGLFAVLFILGAIANMQTLDDLSAVEGTIIYDDPSVLDYIAAAGQSAGYAVAAVVCWAAALLLGQAHERGAD